jgi:uncharacterized DUF497 family protein
MNDVLFVQNVWTRQESNEGHAIGAAQLSTDAPVVLFVVHVYREEINGEEIIRIISARRANKDDFRRYQEQEMD